jgi:hypothetical protein
MLLAATLPLSIFATSVIQFLLVINWLVEGRYAEKWNRLAGNRAFWVYTGFYALHIVGMLWSSDLQYGLRDLKIKLPLLVIPFIIVSSEELSARQIRAILAAFIAGTMTGSLASLLALLKWIPSEMDNYRNASLFISHIRFSLMIVLAIMFSAYLFFRRAPGEQRYLRVMYLLALLLLPVFLVILRSLSGIVIIVLVVLVLSLLLVRTVPDRAGRFMLTVLIITIPLFIVVYTGNAINRFYSFEQVDPGELDSLTIEGNPYIHYPDNKETENGNFVWINVCPKELEREWGKVSDYDYMGKADNGDFIRFTLIRYLTSRGLRKDAAGIRQLNETDIRAIESGIANHIYLNRFRLYPRIYEVIWEFDRYRLGFSPNDKSLVQRYYYLRAGVNIASENLLYGVGTGDVRQAFDRFYEENDSPLRLERRRRAHNQYLTLVVAFGIPGLLVCLFALVLPVFMRDRWRSFMTLVFIITMALSMLDEDTLENTPGAVMFGLFYALFVFGPGWPWRKKKIRV